MKKNQRDQLKMIRTVLNLIKKNTSLWTPHPVLVNAIGELNIHFSAVNQMNVIRSGDVSGITISKSKNRITLIKKAFDLSTNLASYFIVQQNQELFQSAHFPISTLQRMKHKELIGACFNLHQLASNELSNLGLFMITATTLTDFMQAINAFNMMVNAPLEQRTTQAEATKAMNLELRNCMNYLNQKLDYFIKLLQTTQPQFVALYQRARSIDRSPTHRRSLTITCIDANSKLPIVGVQLQIVGQKTKRISGAKGKSFVQNLAAGKYNLLVEHVAFESQTIAFTIVANKMTKVEISLVD
jgi:hypothetical protein